MVMGLLVEPGAMVPVLNEPLSAVAVCVMTSALRHATVWPTFTVPGFGENEFPPFMPVIVIVTLAVPPACGVGDMALLLLLPHAVRTAASTSNPPSFSVLLGFITSPSRAQAALSSVDT